MRTTAASLRGSTPGEPEQVVALAVTIAPEPEVARGHPVRIDVRLLDQHRQLVSWGRPSRQAVSVWVTPPPERIEGFLRCQSFGGMAQFCLQLFAPEGTYRLHARLGEGEVVATGRPFHLWRPRLRDMPRLTDVPVCLDWVNPPADITAGEVWPEPLSVQLSDGRGRRWRPPDGTLPQVSLRLQAVPSANFNFSLLGGRWVAEAPMVFGLATFPRLQAAAEPGQHCLVASTKVDDENSVWTDVSPAADLDVTWALQPVERRHFWTSSAPFMVHASALTGRHGRPRRSRSQRDAP